MCSVSAVHDYFQRNHPLPSPHTWGPNFPTLPSFQQAPAPQITPMMPVRQPPEVIWNTHRIGLLKGALKLLEQLDAELGEPDCVDPQKAAYMSLAEAQVAGAQSLQAPPFFGVPGTSSSSIGQAI